MVQKTVSCPVELTLSIMAGRWKVMIIHQLLLGSRRFNQLQRELRGITHRTLTKNLREMASQNLVIRTVYQEIPPHVEYRLSPLGLSLKPILTAMHEWSEEYGNQIAIDKNY
ncbi:MAG: helix-turn-helix transcriptional regulator [Rhodospirillaceae bacterium]|nr:helix-turn-helix transcriptional regulator [Rhodospirillaceae bacterium]